MVRAGYALTDFGCDFVSKACADPNSPELALITFL
jgi:hypothetical protein